MNAAPLRVLSTLSCDSDRLTCRTTALACLASRHPQVGKPDKKFVLFSIGLQGNRLAGTRPGSREIAP